ncbi:acyl carrier protein [Salinimicrobium catena]|uniref:Acyl carrier protein n=1 Tax=Salinimicrobium catena TaxID=390640 RepID=A0A1H5LRG8_9FLAO|nr:acyl carrier protein [Salinimicrobium catena]SDL13122.1 acyl carrier protein [Salinimicrobium catena]SEE79584.1 acyl carrier protein [Salinimicrobium catena]
METNEIIYCLKKIVKPYVQNDLAFQDFNIKTDFTRDLEINSAHLVDIVLDVEDEFNIAIDNQAMENMMTVGDAVKIIKKKQVNHDR